MKNKILLILLAISAILTPLATRADLIWYEGFNYPDGNITNVSGGLWVCPGGSNGNGTDMLVSAQSLQVSTTSSTVNSRASDDYRFFSITNGSPYTNHVQILYASFTVICTNLPNGPGSYFASFYNPAHGYYGKIQAFTNGTALPNTWRLGITANAQNTNSPDGGFPVDLALNTPYQVVEELDPVTSKSAIIWINPVDLTDNPNVPSGSDPFYYSHDALGASGTNVNTYAFRQASSFGNGFWIITNLDVATTFAEAVTNIYPTNALPPVIVYSPAGVTNFTGSTFNLSAVANGQGLGSLTYQWQQNGANVSNPNGNSNILPFSNASSGTNAYDLIVTTPYGLSTTSTPVTVAVSDAPVPPTFISQPVSQTAYKGQTVIFSTAVSSPGGVTFTWYSNNVMVTAGVNSSGDSSSLELDNVTTNFSTAYTVAVTNNIVVNGIISTNAVLTVINPAQVSIAYLRTLVDPTTYAATNVPPSIPYQVTGTVTTYTNLTSGNTSSYYLQDGTGGINIFVTGGQTFRPVQGDVVTFVGVLSSFSGLELYADSADNSYPYTSYTDTGTTNALPTPISISYDILTNLNNVNYNLDGSLVKLSDVYFGTNAGTVLSTTANNTITVTNSSGKSFKLFFAYVDLNTAGQTLPTYAYSVSGVLYGTSTNEIAITRFSDIITTVLGPIPLTLGYSAGTLTFNWADNTFMLQSSTNVLGPYATIPGASSGFMTNTVSTPAMFFRLYHP
jgi:hypothetical protein